MKRKRSVLFTCSLMASLLLGSASAHAQELIVSAAASLANAFKEIGTAFEKEHAGVKIVFNFAASGPLLQQIERGAPVDVFATADLETMDAAAEKKLIDRATRRDFVSNRLVLVVPADAKVIPATLADLKAPGIKRIGIGNPATVPVGRYAREVLVEEKLWDAVRPKLIFADSVRQVLDYASRGEVDAGFVYTTDVGVAKDRVKRVLEVRTTRPILYPIATVSSSKHPRLAKSFAAYVSGPAAQAVLARYGFGKP